MTRRLVLLSVMGLVLTGALGFLRDAAAQSTVGGVPQQITDVQRSLGVIDSKLSSILPLDLGFGTTLATDFLLFQDDPFNFQFGVCSVLNAGTDPLTVRVALRTSTGQVLGVKDVPVDPGQAVEVLDGAFRLGGCTLNAPVNCWCTFTYVGPANAIRAHIEKFVLNIVDVNSITTPVAREAAR